MIFWNSKHLSRFKLQTMNIQLRWAPPGLVRSRRRPSQASNPGTQLFKLGEARAVSTSTLAIKHSCFLKNECVFLFLLFFFFFVVVWIWLIARNPRSKLKKLIFQTMKKWTSYNRFQILKKNIFQHSYKYFLANLSAIFSENVSEFQHFSGED